MILKLQNPLLKLQLAILIEFPQKFIMCGAIERAMADMLVAFGLVDAELCVVDVSRLLRDSWLNGVS